MTLDHDPAHVDDPAHLDGNAAAGVLRGLFTVDLTAALGGCGGCGRRAALADGRLYADAPGLVVRCPDCDLVLLRVVASPDRTWLDLRGLAYVEMPTPPAAAP